MHKALHNTAPRIIPHPTSKWPDDLLLHSLYVVEEVDGVCRCDDGDGDGCVRGTASVIASVVARW